MFKVLCNEIKLCFSYRTHMLNCDEECDVKTYKQAWYSILKGEMKTGEQAC